MSERRVSRRRFLQGTAAAAGLMIVPRHVLGGGGRTPPSEVITRGVVGTGGQGMGGHVMANLEGRPPVCLAVCDVDKTRLRNALTKAGPGCEGYGDFRRVMDRKDIDTIHIATPPHWHALVCIAAAQAGKDILCEKPLTRFIREGQAVVDAVERYGRVLQIGTYHRFEERPRRLRKLVASGLLGSPLTVRVTAANGYNWKVKEWTGRIDVPPETTPAELDYDFWLGPAPYKPYFRHRTHGSFRGYWDYDGGGLADMAEHYLDPVQYILGKDDESPVEVEAYAPYPPHPDAVLMWGRVNLKYADGTTVILESGEWGDREEGEHAFIEGPKGKVFGGSEGVTIRATEPENLLDELRKFPEPEPLVDFNTAIRTRKQPGGNARVSHRCATMFHLANIAIRLGRKLKYDPIAQQFPGDEEANRLADLPMRAPWHL